MKKITLLIFASLLSICGFAQLSNESFESVWAGTPGAPPGWTVVNEAGPAVTWVRSPANSTSIPPHSGSYAAYLNKENVAAGNPTPKDWLITPYFNMPANAELHFFSRLTFPGDQGGSYAVKISTDPDPNNLASYTDLQTWTETSLNPTQTDYFEKMLTLPAITGSVHIAFVMESKDHDRWIIDDVKVTSQCVDPTGLTVSNITMTTAQFNWTNNGAATSWEIEVVSDIANPTGVGEIYVGAPPYTKNTGLAPDSSYRVYIRGICPDDGTTKWLGPIYFNTAALGESCSYPLVVTPLPYTTTNNTANFADNYNGSPGSSCGTTATYLSGNDVVYEYTPTTNGNINISLTGAVTGAAMFVYDNCADIGTSCIAGGIGNVTVPSLAVVANNSIYIVISSSSSVNVTPYTLNIQQVYCAAPTGLTAANPTSFSGDLTWAAGTATAWQLAVQPDGTGLPTGSGINVTTNTVTALQTLTGNSLLPASAYEYYVRANCGDGTYSIWTGPFKFSTTQIPAALPYTQDWETTPNNWTISNGTQINKWAVGNAVNNGGSQSLYISNNNGVNNVYTITSASVVHAYRDVIIPPGTGSVNLAFDWKSIGESADYIRAYLVPVSFTPTPGTQIVSSASNIKIGGDLYGSSNWSVFNGVANVSTITGTRRLVLEWRNSASLGSQPPAAIDNINLSVITCPAPSAPAIVAGTLTNSSVNISWTAPTSIPPLYDYYISTASTPPTAATIPTDTATTTTATGVTIQPSTTHYFWVRANCGTGDTSTWTGPLIFIAPQIPATMDYTQNFDSGPHSWALSNGTQTNKWIVGTAANNSSPNALYISQDNGTTNTYNFTSTSTVHAYRDIQIPNNVDQLELSFDWKAMGEGSVDYIKVWLAPNTFNPTAGTLITATNATPLGTLLNLKSTWTTQSIIIQAATLGIGGSQRRLIFEWRNDSASGTQGPAAIDNINFRLIPCPQPSTITMPNLTQAAASFAWTPPVSGAAAYEYYVSTDPTAPTAASPVNGNTTTATAVVNNLPPSTTHYFWVRTDCTTSKSYWIGPYTFVTPQIPAAMNYSQNFDMATHNWEFMNGTQVNKWMVGNGTSNSAPNSMFISNNNSTNVYSNSTSIVHAYRDIAVPSTADEVLLSFDWKAAGEASLDYFKIWLVPTSFIPVPGTAIAAATGRVPVGTTFLSSAVWGTSNIIIPSTAFKGQTMRLVFEWRNNATNVSQPPAAIDNINFSVVTCPAPTNLLMPLNNSSGTIFTWTPPATVPAGYDFYYTESATPPGANTIPLGYVTGPTATLTGLPDSTNLFFWVRDNCGSGDVSLWLGPFEFNTTLVPVNLNYTENFEGNTYGWIIKNGTQTNKWVVGTAASVNNSGAKTLYVSDDNGLTNTYTNTAASVVHAYKDFIVPTGTTTIDFTFDWKNLGQSGVDYIKVWRVPNSYVPTTGTLIPTAADRQLLGTLSANSSWSTATYILNSTGYAGTTMRIIFEWRNDATTGSQPPGAIDNIDISMVTCPKPTALGASLPTTTGATLNWTEAGTATNWEVYIVPTGQPAPSDSSTGVSASSSTFAYTTPALQPSSDYIYYVRAVCSGSDKSKWAGPFAFKTAIGNDECTGSYTLAVNPIGHDCESSSKVSYYGATASSQSINCGGVNGGDIWYNFVATSDRANIELSQFTINAAANPVIIELYQGNVCGSLIYLGCATTNVMLAKNLVPGTTYRIRLYINKTPANLNTVFKVCVNTPPLPASSNQSACTITTINDSFQNPVISATPTFLHQNTVQGWKTTATDQMMEYWLVPNYESIPAYDDDQFVELNANVVSGLFQDYDTPQSTIFNYEFGHRGRRGADTCELRAGPPGGPYVPVTTATTDNTAWATYTGTYTTPANQPVTRFIFQAVSTFTGDNTIGNFLDGIKFTADNGVLSVTPYALTCVDNVTTVIASGSGEWSALPDNPAETDIANFKSNNTTISGFTATGTYRYNWTTQYCSSIIEVTFDNGSIPEPVVVSTVDYCIGQTAAPLTATALTGHTLKWYTDAIGGTGSATAPTPDTTIAGTTSYYVSQLSDLNCESPRAQINVVVNEKITPVTEFAYDAVTYCAAAANPVITTAANFTASGTFTAVPAGLALDTATGAIDLSTSTPGTYDVTYDVSGSPCSTPDTHTVSVTVTAATQPFITFSYAASPVCINSDILLVTPATMAIPGFAQGGVFSCPTLTLYPKNGVILMANAVVGVHNITYTLQPDPIACIEGGTYTTQIEFLPIATPVTGFTYAGEYCIADANPVPAFNTGFQAGGTFSATGGLPIDPSTGEIDMSAATAGSYDVTYAVTEEDCIEAGSTTATIVINPLTTPEVTFSYDSPVCINSGNEVNPAFGTTFTAGGVFSSSTVTVDAATGKIDLTTATAGSHDIVYTIPVNSLQCVDGGTFTATIELAPGIIPVTEFDYDNSFCFGATNASPNLAADFTTGGTFTGTSGLVIDAVTGEVNIASSASGVHTVTYTYAADPVNCVEARSNTSIFTIGSEFLFSFKGECQGSAYVVTASPVNGNFDDNDPSVSFKWTTTTDNIVGSDTYTLNVTDYASSTPENDTFPMELALTVTIDGCETTRTFIVDGIGCTIQKGISPNNDGYNDYFDLEFMGVKKLAIFNRYGQEVYTKTDYKNEWIGQTNHGDELPTGTYYYVIERSAGGTDTGWIYINRQD